MGRVKEYWIEMQQTREDARLAEKLGLTIEELNETEWSIDTDASNDGLIYGYVVHFEDGPQEILDKIKGLDKDNQVWFNPNDFEDDFDEYDRYDDYDYEEQYETIISNKHYYDSFQQEIENLRKLNQIKIDNGLLPILKRQLYVSAIGTLETFLSETFINQTDENKEYYKNFIETFPPFKDQVFSLRNIFRQYEKLDKTVKKAMLEVIYHNLDKVQNMYKTTFKIDFPEIGELSKAVAIRHDLVHRNGKTKDGIEVEIDKTKIDELIENISQFVETISLSLNLKGILVKKNHKETTDTKDESIKDLIENVFNIK